MRDDSEKAGSFKKESALKSAFKWLWFFYWITFKH
jgi:hypothetical protein